MHITTLFFVEFVKLANKMGHVPGLRIGGCFGHVPFNLCKAFKDVVFGEEAM